MPQFIVVDAHEDEHAADGRRAVRLECGQT